MADKAYSVQELADLLAIDFRGNPQQIIQGISEINTAGEHELIFAFDPQYYEQSQQAVAACLLVKPDFPFQDQQNYLISQQPRLDMARILQIFAPPPESCEGIHPLAHIGENCQISASANINPFVYIGNNVKIGANVIIMPHTYIGPDTVIGDNTLIYPNVSILAATQIGQQVIIHSGTVIGSDGYGFTQLKNNYHYKIPQLGNVIIEAEVEIGANVTIDRATLGSTVIGKGSKIDNQVHIAHNVKIGEQCLLIVQVGIAGSSKIGKNSVLAGQAGVAGHLELGEGVRVAGKSGVTKNFPPGQKLAGYPARDFREEVQQQANIKKIPKLQQELNALKEKIRFLEEQLQRPK